MSAWARTGHCQEDSLSEQLLWMIQGYILSQVVHVIAKLGIADLVTDGPQTSFTLAKTTATDPDALYRLLITGAAFGLLDEIEPHTFSLRPLGELLRTGASGSLRDYAISMAAPGHWLPCGHLEQAIRNGRPSFEEVFGSDLWQYHAQHSEEGIRHGKMLGNVSALIADDIVAQFNVSSFQKIVDVGANHGGLLAALLRAAPRAAGILFDLPSVIAGARGAVEQLGLSGRVELIGGDFFREVPGGGDLYILMRILHNWDDTQCGIILRNIHRACTGRGTLLVIERLMPMTPEPSPVYLSDLNMLMRVGGRERSRENFRTLLTSAGYRLERIIPISGFFNMIEAART